jgi:hypothetical protein
MVGYGCTYSPCPRCGGTGLLIDGVFGAAGEALRIIAAPQASIDVLRALGLDLIESYERGASAEEVARKAAAVDPGLGRLLLALRDDPRLFVQVLVAVIALVTALVTDEKIDLHFDNWFSTTINNFEEQAAPRTVERARDALKHSARPHSVGKHQPGH